MLYLCFDVIKKNMKIKFLLNLILNFLLNSVLIPIILHNANHNFIENNIQSGITISILAILIFIPSSYHSKKILETQRKEFRCDVIVYTISQVNDKIKKLVWNELREQINKNELNRKKEDIKYGLTGFIMQIINTVIHLCTLCGSIFWLGYISPVSMIIYIILFIIIIKYILKIKPIKIRNNENYDRYYELNTNLYTDIIHNNEKKTLDELNNCMIKIEKENLTNNNNDLYMMISLLFFICFILNLLIISNQIKQEIKPVNMIMYIHYTYNLLNCINMCISLSSEYDYVKIQYDKLFDTINNIENKVNRHKINNFIDIYIEELTYTYPSKLPFTLNLIEPIIFKAGEIIKFEGAYGNGKSTFCDILNGIIPDNKYQVKLKINSNTYTSFDHLCNIRYYHEQFENIVYKASIYEIISGNTEIKSEEEIKVWRAIQITLCDNFMTNIEDDLTKKYIHSKNVGLSGGQKYSISVARTIYRIIKNQPQIVTLDEIDKSIPADVVTKIMENIYKYCISKQILLFVICHSTEVNEMKYYNKTLRFRNGFVHLIN